jgi:endonuclease YncB( thermonuclease family)
MTTEELESKLHWYKAIITDVIDGDTVDAKVSYGFHGWVKLRFRVYQDSGFYFDTPETRKYRGVTDEHKAHGLEAKARAEELLLNKEVYLKSYKEGSFRWLGEIWLSDGRAYADVMISEGFQKKDNY